CGGDGRDLRGHVAAGPHPAVATALPARVGDDLAETATDRAWPGGDHLAEEGPLHRLDLALATAGVAGAHAAAGRGARAPALITEDGGVDGDVLVHTARALLEGERDPDE